MQDFVFRETGPGGSPRDLRSRPAEARVLPRDFHLGVDLPRSRTAPNASSPDKWGERGDVAGFRADEARVVAFLQDGYRRAVPPSLDAAERALGAELMRLWITGSAADLLDHYFTAEHTKVYMGMTVTESGPVSLREPYSAFTLPLMDSGSSSMAITASCETASGASPRSSRR